MKRIALFRANPIDCRSRSALVAGVVVLALLPAGCAERRVHAAPFPWATATAVRPRIPALAPGYAPGSLDEGAPDLRWDIPPALSRLAVAKTPSRPRTLSAAPADPVTGSTKTDPLSLAPQLTEQEAAAAQRQMNDSISAAQKNLAAAKGRRLNPTQADLVAKINSFIEESRGAARDGDWTRARNLAKKAQVLGEELADSL